MTKKTTQPEKEIKKPVQPESEKEVKKTAQPKKETKKAKISNKPHPKSMHRQRSQKYLQVKKIIDKNKSYSPEEAVKLAKKISYASFDASLDLHLNTLKTGSLAKVKLPFGTGKQRKIAIVDDKVLKQIAKGQIDFDVLLTQPKYMPQLVKYARLLGPKGLMPNPKNGTISQTPEKLKTEMEKGTNLEIKTEAKANVAHLSIGRTSFKEKELLANLLAVLKVLKPTEVKSVYLAPTMGPSIKLQFPL